jgi:uncharacterized membrane protein YkvA (DUF1232 family)
VSGWLWLLLVLVALWLLAVAGLVLAGRREDARALAGFVPDCVVLVGRLARDPAVGRRSRVLLLLLGLYLASPIDLVPDVLPVAGQLDDAILLALVLRGIVRRAGPETVRRHWPGPPGGLAVVLRLAGGS